SSALANRYLDDLAAAEARDSCAGSDVRVLPGTALLHKRHHTAAARVQTPAGTPGPRRCAFGSCNSCPLWPEPPGRTPARPEARTRPSPPPPQIAYAPPTP